MLGYLVMALIKGWRGKSQEVSKESQSVFESRMLSAAVNSICFFLFLSIITGMAATFSILNVNVGFKIFKMYVVNFDANSAAIYIITSLLQNIDAPRPSKANPLGDTLIPKADVLTSDQFIEGLKKKPVLDERYPGRLSIIWRDFLSYAIT